MSSEANVHKSVRVEHTTSQNKNPARASIPVSYQVPGTIQYMPWMYRMAQKATTMTKNVTPVGRVRVWVRAINRRHAPQAGGDHSAHFFLDYVRRQKGAELETHT